MYGAQVNSCNPSTYTCRYDLSSVNWVEEPHSLSVDECGHASFNDNTGKICFLDRANIYELLGIEYSTRDNHAGDFIQPVPDVNNNFFYWLCYVNNNPGIKTTYSPVGCSVDKSAIVLSKTETQGKFSSTTTTIERSCDVILESKNYAPADPSYLYWAQHIKKCDTSNAESTCVENVGKALLIKGEDVRVTYDAWDAESETNPGVMICIGYDTWTDPASREKYCCEGTATYAGELKGVITTPTGVSASSQLDGGYLCDDEYFYKVTALDERGGETLPSNEVICSIDTGDCNNQCRIEWDAVEGAVLYRVYTHPPALPGYILYKETTDTSLVDDGKGYSTGSPPVRGIVNPLSEEQFLDQDWLTGVSCTIRGFDGNTQEWDVYAVNSKGANNAFSDGDEWGVINVKIETLNTGNRHCDNSLKTCVPDLGESESCAAHDSYCEPGLSCYTDLYQLETDSDPTTCCDVDCTSKEKCFGMGHVDYDNNGVKYYCGIEGGTIKWLPSKTGGEACSFDYECLSEQCVDGVCCDGCVKDGTCYEEGSKISDDGGLCSYEECYCYNHEWISPLLEWAPPQPINAYDKVNYGSALELSLTTTSQSESWIAVRSSSTENQNKLFVLSVSEGGAGVLTSSVKTMIDDSKNPSLLSSTSVNPNAPVLELVYSEKNPSNIYALKYWNNLLDGDDLINNLNVINNDAILGSESVSASQLKGNIASDDNKNVIVWGENSVIKASTYNFNSKELTSVNTNSPPGAKPRAINYYDDGSRFGVAWEDEGRIMFSELSFDATPTLLPAIKVSTGVNNYNPVLVSAGGKLMIFWLKEINGEKFVYVSESFSGEKRVTYYGDSSDLNFNNKELPVVTWVSEHGTVKSFEADNDCSTASECHEISELSTVTLDLGGEVWSDVSDVNALDDDYLECRAGGECVAHFTTELLSGDYDLYVRASSSNSRLFISLDDTNNPGGVVYEDKSITRDLDWNKVLSFNHGFGKEFSLWVKSARGETLLDRITVVKKDNPKKYVYYLPLSLETLPQRIYGGEKILIDISSNEEVTLDECVIYKCKNEINSKEEAEACVSDANAQDLSIDCKEYVLTTNNLIFTLEISSRALNVETGSDNYYVLKYKFKDAIGNVASDLTYFSVGIE